MVFAREFLDPVAVGFAALGFSMFCVASSAVYIVNDLHDIERDRLHPVKRAKRPLAAGTVTVRTAIVLLLALYLLLAAGFVFAPGLILPILCYLVLNLAYTYFLKDQPVLDLFSVASGFVIRVWAGAEVLNVPLSSWMAITTLCLALYLASIKRRQELQNAGPDARQVLKQYSIVLVDRYAEMSAVGALIFYSLFVMSTNARLVMTIPLVIFGLFRYWFVVDNKDEGESPTDVVLTDWPLIVCILIWIGVCGVSLAH